jgi:hypothetical protein
MYVDLMYVYYNYIIYYHLYYDFIIRFIYNNASPKLQNITSLSHISYIFFSYK